MTRTWTAPPAASTLSKMVKSGLFIASYWLWLALAHLIGLSLVTYGVMDATPRFNEIADLYFTNYWTIQGWAAGLFLLVNAGLTVGRAASWPEFHWSNIKIKVLPLVLRTGIAALGWVLLMLWVTPAQFLGPGFSWEEGFWPLLSCISRAIAWLAWAFAEEWVFRKVLLEKLRTRYSAWISILIVTALWTLTRSWHQGLGLNQTITLILLGMALGLSVCQGRSYLTGAAILGTSTLIFQVLFSLPVLGQDFTGIWIIKFRAENLLQLVSGGPGGPLSSAFLQLALASWIAFNWKIVWTPKSPQLR